MKNILFTLSILFSFSAHSLDLNSPYDAQKARVDQSLQSTYEELALQQKQVGALALAPGNVRDQVQTVADALATSEFSEVSSAFFEMETYFKVYDDYNRAFIDVLAFREQKTAEFFLNHENKKIRKLAQKVLVEAKGYEDNKHKFYENSDFDRIVPFRRLHKVSRSLKYAVDKHAGLKPDKAPNQNKGFVKKYAFGFLKFVSKLVLKKHSNDGKTPALDSIRGYVLKMGERAGYTLKWHGLENMPQLGKPNGKDVYLFTHTHHNAILDNYALAALNLYGIGSVGSADLVFPKQVVDLMLKNDEFIVTSRNDDEGAFKKLVRVLKEKRLNGFVVPSEGMAAAAYEIRPMRKKVTDYLVKGLWAEGFRVHLVPISYKNNFRFGSVYRFVSEDLPREVDAYVSPIVTDEMLRTLVQETGSVDSIALFVRGQWHVPLINDGILIESQPSVAQMVENVDQYVAGEIEEAP